MRGVSFIVPTLLLLSLLACSKKDKTTAPRVPTVPRDGLVAEYVFDGNANDTQGTNHGVVTEATLIPDRFGRANRAYSFDGVNDFISTTQDHFISSNNISVSLWFKTSMTGLRFFVFCSDFGIWTQLPNAGIAISVSATESAGGSVTADTWHHLLGTYNGTEIRAYIDGALAQVTNHPGNIADLNRPLEFGRFGTTIYWAGEIDDMRIYNRVISSVAEISDLYHEGGFAQ